MNHDVNGRVEGLAYLSRRKHGDVDVYCTFKYVDAQLTEDLSSSLSHVSMLPCMQCSRLSALLCNCTTPGT